MALTSYINATRNLLQVPSAPTQLYTDAALTTYINTARNQIAGEGECIHVLGTISTAVASRTYAFSAIAGLAASVGSVLHVRRISYNVGAGQKWVTPRSWPYFDYYFLNNPVPVNGPPKRWTQVAQGVLGTFQLDPPPDQIYTLNLDCIALPIALVDDNMAEAVPALWTDCIPYFAAYLAYLSAQAPARQADAQRMFSLYTEFMNRARQFSNPDVLRGQYFQATDETMAAKLGMQAKQGAA